MSKTRDTGNITNVIKVDATGNVSFVSGSTTLATISTSGQMSGSLPALSSSYALSASYVTNAETLDGLDSTVFTLTSSFNTTSASLYTVSSSAYDTSGSLSATSGSLSATSGSLSATSGSLSATSGSLSATSGSLSAASGSLSAASGSFNTRVTALEITGSALSSSILSVSASSYLTSGSLSSASGSFDTRISTVESKYATTGSNTFIGTQIISGSILQSGSFTSTGTLTAQTLVVQTITSSVVYSSGSNIFGNSLGNSQVFTGSVLITGSLTIAGGSSATSYSGTTIYGSTVVCSPVGKFTSCIDAGSGTFSSSVTAKGTLTLGDAGVTNAIINSNDGMYFNIDADVSGGSPEFMFGKGRSGAGSGGTTFFAITCTGAATFSSTINSGIITATSLVSNGQVSLYDYVNVQNNYPNFTQLSGIRGRAYYQTNYPTSILMGDPTAANVNIITFNVSDTDVTGTEKMRITSAGISVTGAATFSSSVTAANLILNGTTTTALDLTSGTFSYALDIQNNDFIRQKNVAGTLGLVFGMSTDDNLYVRGFSGINLQVNNGTTALALTSTGNVGIGTAQTGGAITRQLEVYNNQGATTSNTYFRISGGAGGAYGGNQYIEFTQNDYGNTSVHIITGKIQVQSDPDGAGYAYGSMQFYTKGAAGNSSAVERMRITNAGDVGIGTTTPCTMLHVQGQATIGCSTYRTRIDGSSAGTSISFGTLACSNFLGKIGTYSSAYILDSNNGDISFRFGSCEKAYINSSGSIARKGFDSHTSGQWYKIPFYMSKSNGVGNTDTQCLVIINNNDAFYHLHFTIEYGSRLQGVSDQSTQTSLRSYGVNRFNSSTATVNDAYLITGGSGCAINTHAPVTVAIVGSCMSVVKVDFSSSIGNSSFVWGQVKIWSVESLTGKITISNNFY